MRPADWSAAGFGHDPVPGDPDQVRRGGQSYLEIAGTIRRTATGLRTLELDGTVSEAIDALATTASTVADDISRAEARYRATGNALVSYATQLAGAQDDSLTALRRAQAAQGAAEDAQNDRRRYLRLADSAADPTETLRLERLADAAGADGRHADAATHGARDDILAAAARRDRAAESARADIENTTSGDDLGDSWWDDWGADVLAVITDVAGVIASIAGILALVVSWIPVIGQVLAAALLLVAGIAAVVNAIGNTVLAATGERSWGEAIVSILGAALSVIGLGAAARIVGNVAAAGRINAMARLQSGWAGERLTVLQAIRLRPSTLRQSEGLWRAPVAAPSNGDDAFRIWGGGSGSGGPSWTGMDPRTLSQPREMFGLPTVNNMETLSIGTVTDSSQVLHVRHGLPLDGMPGGAPEWVFPGGSPVNPLVGRVTITDVPFVVAP